jgi:hypothetical protein
LPWHGNRYQGERASEKRQGSEEPQFPDIQEMPTNQGVEGVAVEPPGALTTPDFGKSPNGRVQSISAGPLREELALALRILGLCRNPSKARDLCLVLVRRLERLTEATRRSEVG